MRASRRLLAVSVVALGLTGGAARGDDLHVDPGVPAPAVSSPLIWREAHGFWFTDAQIVKLNARVNYLETRAAKECVDRQIDAARGTSRWVWVAAGVATGVALGYCATVSGHCHLYK